MSGAYGFAVFPRGNDASVTLRLTKRVARLAEPLEPISDRIQEAVRTLPRPVREALDGVWLGVPLHPALTDVPLGAWTAAAMLDLAESDAADAALAVGVVGALPAALTGLNDWSYLRGETKRVGTVHAILNSTALVLNLASLLARRNGARGFGRLLSGTAYAGSLFSAHLGGELSFGFGVRVNRTAFERAPADFAPVMDAEELEGGKLARAEIDGASVLVARSEATGDVCAISAVCTHLGGPLDQGQREGDVVVCPWHGSRFDLCTGDVEGGPAVFPEPRYEARVRDGKVEVRLAPED